MQRSTKVLTFNFGNLHSRESSRFLAAKKLLLFRGVAEESASPSHQISRSRAITRSSLRGVFSLFILIVLASLAPAQDWVQLIINKGTPIRLAVPDFKAANSDPQTAPLNTVFNQTLWNDLDNSGIFDMVSKSFYPLQ